MLLILIYSFHKLKFQFCQIFCQSPYSTLILNYLTLKIWEAFVRTYELVTTKSET